MFYEILNILKSFANLNIFKNNYKVGKRWRKDLSQFFIYHNAGKFKFKYF